MYVHIGVHNSTLAGFPQKYTLRPGFKCKEFIWEVTPGNPGDSGGVRKRRSAIKHCRQRTVGNAAHSLWGTVGNGVELL